MEEVFDKIKVQASKAKDGAVKLTKIVIDKTNNVVNQTKLKYAINETEDKISEIYAEIGKAIYDGRESDTDISDVISEKCDKIDSLQAEVSELKEQLAQLKETVKCSECGAYNHADDLYCSKCGQKLRTVEEFASEYDEDAVIIDVSEDEE